MFVPGIAVAEMQADIGIGGRLVDEPRYPARDRRLEIALEMALHQSFQ